jgi:hypothetical protein
MSMSLGRCVPLKSRYSTETYMSLKIGESVRCSNPNLEWFKHPPHSMVVRSLYFNKDAEEIAVLQVTWISEIRVLAGDFSARGQRLERLTGMCPPKANDVEAVQSPASQRAATTRQ